MKRDSLQDFIDFLKCLKKNRVNFVVVGAHAMSFWGYVRATGDIDILIDPEIENCERLMLALKEFGAPLKKTKEADFQILGTVFQIGIPPVRIDILNALDGVETTDIFEKSVSGMIMGVKVKIMHLSDLIKNKKSTGRSKDLLDVKELNKIKK